MIRHEISQDGEVVLNIGPGEPFAIGGVSYPGDWLSRGGALPGGYDLRTFDADQESAIVEARAREDAALASDYGHVAEAIGAARHALEVGGMTINGIPVRTDRESVAIMAQAISNAPADVTDDEVITFRTGPGGFVDMPLGQLRAITSAIWRRTQALRAAEKALFAEFTGGSRTFTDGSSVQAEAEAALRQMLGE